MCDLVLRSEIMTVLQSLDDSRNSSRSWSSPPVRPVLGTRDVHVWRASLDPPPAIVERLRQLLSPDEQVRADRFHFDIDRQHFIVSRGCLRTILSRYLEIAPAEFQFSYESHGKPRIASANSQAERLKFNVAH